MPRSSRPPSEKTVTQSPDPEPEEEVLPSPLMLWTEMMEHDSEEVVAEIMETLLSNVLDHCFQVDIKQKLIPYTTNWMKKQLVQSIEQRFLCRDEGDGPEDVLPEDSEPPTAEPDAWAKGCVPLVSPSPPLTLPSPQEVEVVQQEKQPEVVRKLSTIPQPKVSSKLPTKKTIPNLTVANINKYRSSFPPPKMEKKSIQVPPRAKSSKFLPPLNNSTDKKTEKTHENRSRTVDSKEWPAVNLLHKHKVIQKLDPADLPDHCVFPKYEIVDPNAKTQRKRAIRPPPRGLQQESEPAVRAQRTEVHLRPECSPDPLRLDSMVMARGVTLSQSLDQNLPLVSPQTPAVKLRPIRTEPEPFRFPVDCYFVADPQVKPLSPT